MQISKVPTKTFIAFGIGVCDEFAFIDNARQYLKQHGGGVIWNADNVTEFSSNSINYKNGTRPVEVVKP